MLREIPRGTIFLVFGLEEKIADILRCPLAEKVPREWLFQRHGRNVRDKSQYQRGFRNSEVAVYADSVIDRLVREFGVGYIKNVYT